MAKQKEEDSWSLSRFSDTLEEASAKIRAKQERARNAVLRAEARVALTEKSLEIIQWVNRLAELKALGGSFSFGCETDEQAAELEHSIVTLTAYINGLDSYSNGLE